MFAYKCLLFGKELFIIDERDTTKMCHVCKHKQDMPLWKRTYRCENENCGLVMDRDANSAVNIYHRFVAGPPPHRYSATCDVLGLCQGINITEHITNHSANAP